MTKLAYSLDMPTHHSAAVVFASPHSGRDYSWSFLQQTQLDALEIRSSEDAFVDQLFDAAPGFGAPLLRANAPRAYVDLNRSMDELDPALIEGVRRTGHNPRVASGLGVVPRVVAGGRAIYCGKLTKAEAEQRLQLVWQPYHAKLQQLLDMARQRFGTAVLIDCHSMPHEAVDGGGRRGEASPEIVIGDRFGASASSYVVEQVEAAFASRGFRVARNAPFAGAYTTQHYGRPSRNQHAIQIEIDRALYMSEATVTPNGRFQEIRAALRHVVADITCIGLTEQNLAAE